MGRKNNNNAEQISLFDDSNYIINKENLKLNKKERKISFNISHSIVELESVDLFDTGLNKKKINNIIPLPNINIKENEEKNNFYELPTNNNEILEETDIEDEKEEESSVVVAGLNNFFKEVNEYRLLTREEEQKYFKEYNKTKDKKLKQFLISSNIKLVIAVAKKISKRNKKMPLEDMIDEGVMGLIKAIDKFKPEKGYKFSTYAFFWIQQAITRYIANTGDIIRVPVHFSDNLLKIKHFENEYMIQNNVDFVDEKITSNELKIPLEKIKKYKKATQNISSLDIVIDENENTRMDITEDKCSLNPECAIMNTCLHDALLKAINTLNSRESFIIINKYNLDKSNNVMTLGEIAKKFNLTKERIRQIEAGALKKLAHPMKSREYREFY